ncbi:hypothetical protein BJY52DRAFT_887340 [Lactarius psammicola]|nr:hypothetical protein BJY52DRAFT_887340 [Lactarius psammicola]
MMHFTAPGPSSAVRTAKTVLMLPLRGSGLSLPTRIRAQRGRRVLGPSVVSPPLALPRRVCGGSRRSNDRSRWNRTVRLERDYGITPVWLLASIWGSTARTVVLTCIPAFLDNTTLRPTTPDAGEDCVGLYVRGEPCQYELCIFPPPMLNPPFANASRCAVEAASTSGGTSLGRTGLQRRLQHWHCARECVSPCNDVVMTEDGARYAKHLCCTQL